MYLDLAINCETDYKADYIVKLNKSFVWAFWSIFAILASNILRSTEFLASFYIIFTKY